MNQIWKNLRLLPTFTNKFNDNNNNIIYWVPYFRKFTYISLLILTLLSLCEYYYLHFIAEESEVQEV